MPGTQDCLVKLEGVTYAYPGGGPVIRGVSATLHRGELTALTGPNGSGKSTLAGLVAGLFVPGAGRVLVDGLDTADGANRERIRRRVGLVLQNPDNQFVASRVDEDVAFGPENLNLPPQEVRRRVEYALEAVGLEHLGERPPHLLSGGEKQRLALAGLLALRPRCLVLDEPTAMLDPPGRRDVLRVLRRLAGEGTAVLLVTHHMEEAAAAHRVWVLADGTLVADDTPRALFGRQAGPDARVPALPPAAELARRLSARGASVPAGIINLEDMVHFLCRALR